jgi:bacterioferritin (cytochrome b1)|tara:strand:- start:964 stop:1221 length:258 start_codon:yes stop_codon:yes gene_type:complete
MTGKQIEKYIREDLGYEPRHNCEALARAINYVSDKVDYDSFALMQLLLENEPISSLHTHSYGFHTHNGRELIEGMQNAYYEELEL